MSDPAEHSPTCISSMHRALWYGSWRCHSTLPSRLPDRLFLVWHSRRILCSSRTTHLPSLCNTHSFKVFSRNRICWFEVETPSQTVAQHQTNISTLLPDWKYHHLLWTHFQECSTAAWPQTIIAARLLDCKYLHVLSIGFSWKSFLWAAV